MTQTQRRVLVITGDPVSAVMAGPGIRACELARALAATMDVRVASLVSAVDAGFPFEVVTAHRAKLRPHVQWADVIIVQGFVMALNPWIARTDKVIVADLYDPMHFEHLEDARGEDPLRALPEVDQTIAALSTQLRRADFFVCATEKQRDMWVGHLAAMGRVNPLTYKADDTLRKLIDVVPFGVSDESFNPKSHAIKGVVRGISSKDKVILWGGGIYNWFDPVTLIRGVHALSLKHSNVRLFFLGVAHPNSSVATSDTVAAARAVSDQLGLTQSVVFFNDTWVPYDERARYLGDADVGVSTHRDHLETAFSFRTRILDYLWAGLPVVSTQGDSFATIIDESGAGAVVPEGDVESLARALESMLFSPRGSSAARASRRLASTMTWANVSIPLIRFCETASRSADAHVVPRKVPLRFHVPSWLSGKVRGARALMNRGGVKAITRRIAGSE